MREHGRRDPGRAGAGIMALNPAASFPVFARSRSSRAGRRTAWSPPSLPRPSGSPTRTMGTWPLFLVSPGGRRWRSPPSRPERQRALRRAPAPQRQWLRDGPGQLLRIAGAVRRCVPDLDRTARQHRLDAPITGSSDRSSHSAASWGGPAEGFWTLIVQDVQAQDVGQINALSLNFTYSYKVEEKKKKRR